MKITAVLLLLSMHVAAHSEAQTVTLKVKNTPMKEIFRAIQKQTGLDVMADMALLEKAGNLTLDVKDMPVGQLLNICFKNKPLTFSIIDGFIIVKSNRAPNFYANTDDPPALPPIEIKGRLLDELGEPIVASIFVKGSGKGTTSNENGYFSLSNVDENAVLIITGVNIKRTEIAVKAKSDLGVIVVERDIKEEDEVSVSTGYQKIPKARAAGSFVVIDQKLIESRVGLNILQRMEDYVPGLIFQRDEELGPTSEKTNISIRGTSTILSENQPLIVIDNFPYDGDIKNINPNDVKSITILKDASAASIWGARAGNGVIVIETKTGSFNTKAQVTANVNYTIGEKPNAFLQSQMSVPEYVDVVVSLFDDGFFQYPSISNTTNIQPLIQTLLDRRDGIITSEEAASQINEYKKYDVRREYGKYYYQNSINKQVSINLKGGAARHLYSLNAGFDDNQTGFIGNSYKRLTLDFKNTWKLLKDRLIINGGFNMVNSDKNIGSLHKTSWENATGLYPYSRLADDNGNPLPVQMYNRDFISSAMNDGLLDWNMYPINEIGLSPDITKSTDYRLQAGLTYKLLPNLTVDGLYQYWNNATNGNQLLSAKSYRVRNMVNTFTQVNPGGGFTYPIPNSDILLLNNTNSYSHNVRGQINYNKSWSSKHKLVALAGAEMKDFQQLGYGSGFYGYDDELGISVPVDHVNAYTSYISNYDQIISSFASHSGIINRFQSIYANSSYTFDNRLTFTASARRDASNIFGVETNNRVKPLWSAGLSWEISKEKFYHSNFLPYLKLRNTFGYNGNVNNTIAALLTAQYRGADINIFASGINEPYIVITNPPNPNLRWEKVQIINWGADFAIRNKRLQGSVDYYIKSGIDLIGGEYFPPSSGVISFKGNFANTRTNGIDLDLHSLNTKGFISWNTDLNISIVKEQVTHYGVGHTSNEALSYGMGRRIFDPIPVEGRPLFSVYSYHWAGLDPTTGDPMGFLDGVASTDHNNIIKGYAKAEDMKYHGPGRPPVFGALRNSLSWKELTVSFNISFRLGYYFRRSFLNYPSLTSASSISPVSAEFAERWQQSGDEAFTDIPSFRPTLTGGIANNRNLFYNYSETRVEKGDNIRLQDIMLGYSLVNKPWLPIKEAQLYVNASNLGILWKASKKVKDPDYRTYFEPARNLSIGLRVNL